MYSLENNLQWNEDLKNAFKHNVTRAKILWSGAEINENNKLCDLTLDEERYISNYGFIGTATARQLELNLMDIENATNLENAELTLKIGADTNSKNILDVGKIEVKTSNGITCTYNSTTQEITFNGTCTGDNTLFAFSNTSIPILKNKTRAIIYYVSGSITNNGALRFFDSTYGKQVNFSFVNIATQGVISKTATDDFTAVNNSIRFNIGAVCNNLKIKIMLTNDTDENISYDKYYPSTAYINYGNFIVDKSPEIDDTNGKIRVVAYDYMIKFNKPYIDRVTYPCSLLTLLQDVCSQAGVTLGTTNFANKNFSVVDNQFEGYTLRQVLQEIAKCAFSWARIGQDNRLYLDFDITPTSTETITTDDYKLNSFKKANEEYGPVNQVTYADSNIEGDEQRVKDQESIDENGLKELVIYDNLFAYTTEKRTELIQAGTRLLGLIYMPITQLELIGLAYLDCRDAIEIENIDEDTYSSRVFSHQIKYNGALTDEIVTEGTSNNEEIYKNTATTVFQNQQVRISVDKANKSIQSVVEDLEDNYSTTVQMNSAINQKANEITTTVSQTYSTKTETTNAINGIEIGGRNYIRYGKGDVKDGFFKNFTTVENGYGEHTLTSQNNRAYVSLLDGYVLKPKEYEAGQTVTFSYDIMFTSWNFPEGTDRHEFWIGQRYASPSWQGVTTFNLPVVGGNGCVLNEWYHFSNKRTIPNPNPSSTQTNPDNIEQRIQFHNSNANVSASITFRIKNVKLEFGNKETDWSPAPEDYSTTKEMNSAITQKADEINSSVSATYITKTDSATNISTAKTEAINSANSSTDTKLQNYSTTTQMNSAINQKANEITTSVSQTYSTKTETTNAINNLDVGNRNYFEGTSDSWKTLTLNDGSNMTIYPCATTYLGDKGLKAGDKLRVSFYVKFSNDTVATGTGTKISRVQGNRNVGSNWVSVNVTGGDMQSRIEQIIASESKEGYVQTYITLPANFNDGTYTERWYLGFRFDYYTGTFYVKNMMVCKGDKYLDWTPASEDYSTTTEMNTTITQTADSINTEVAKKVGKSEVISSINQSAEAVTINANKVNLNGYVTVTDLSTSGSTTINGSNVTTGTIKSSNYVANTSGTSINLSNGVIDTKNFKVNSTGNITATGGTIGGCTIDSSGIYSGTGNNTAGVGLNGVRHAFWAGSAENSSDTAPFRVTHTGGLTATSGTIGGCTIDSLGIYSGTGNAIAGVGKYPERFAFWAGADENHTNIAPFRVSHEGALTASNATITGNITATSGTIADYTINGAQLIGSNVGLSGTGGQGWAFWAGSNDSTNAPFRVGHNGSLRATDADITGTITSNNATITGGSLVLNGTTGSQLIKVQKNNSNSTMSYLTPDVIAINGDGDYVELGCQGTPSIDVFRTGSTGTYITHSSVRSPSIVQTSKESLKKDINLYTDNAINIINNSELYTYHFKEEDKNTKLHIGFIIGDKGGKYKTPNEVISADNEGIDTYIMTSILWKAVQEQQKIIEKMQEEIDKLKQ